MLKSDRDKWLQTLYTESWVLYAHEEAISQNKNTFFLSAHGAMLAILTGISSVLIKMGTLTLGDKLVYPGIFILGILTITISVIGVVVNIYWRNTNSAHQAYQKVRWLTARAIEFETGFSDIGPATIEHRWRQFKRSLKKKEKLNFYAFENIAELKEHYIEADKRHVGYDSIKRVIISVSILWIIIMLCGICCIVGSLWLPDTINTILHSYKPMPV